jgi:hypothetical protein
MLECDKHQESRLVLCNYIIEYHQVSSEANMLLEKLIRRLQYRSTYGAIVFPWSCLLSEFAGAMTGVTCNASNLSQTERDHAQGVNLVFSSLI